jgi:omega-6 fatty acid desaturase (delta-12 desaturase)|tara:strand:- start:1141 stop:2178 length:1038 start_codon:yes stop_codon:yes gene_type:complete
MVRCASFLDDADNMKVTDSPAFKASRQYTKASYLKALFHFGHTIGLFFVTIGLMFATLQVHYGLTLLLSVVAATAYLRLFMIGHDCGHGSYLPKKWQNERLGELIGVLTGTPFKYWARQHAKHHSTTGNLDKRGEGDVITKTVEEFNKSGRFAQICYRFYRNPWFMLLVSAPVHFVLLQRLPLGDQMKTREGWISVMGTNFGIFCYYGSLIAIFGLVPFLMVYIPVVMLSSAAAIWLFYVQHQFEGAYWNRKETWTYEQATLTGSSFYNLPRWLHWATGNIGYHHIHHLNPKVPGYQLPDCFDENPVLQKAKYLSIRESLATAKLALWDENAQRLISFKDSSKQT